MALLMMAAGAIADSVDIGLGQMQQSEFVALKMMVQGRQTDPRTAVSTPCVRLERYGLIAMTRADFEILRDIVAGRMVSVEREPTLKSIQMVDIGTGQMPLNEFRKLKRMIGRFRI
jgi:hypothetical protein